MAYKTFTILTFFSIVCIWSNPTFAQSRELFKLNENSYWQSDNFDGTYTNPIIHSDYSDPDVIRVGDDFYLTASSFNCIPGLPILHSKDLINWEHLGYALTKQPPFDVFDKPQHGNGVWAPSIRYHAGEYHIYWGDPDFGIYVIKSQKPEGPWSSPHLVHAAKGWIDPCPFWDENGKAYLVHAFAGSRAGFKNILVINEMSPDGMSLNEECVLVFDGNSNHTTVEGPKLYKRNGWYYIFAPAGGVKPGWQLVLRSRTIMGPYEEKIVLHQGNTNINGPHQGGLVELKSGESWFIHFQDKDAYGRILHLQPVEWILDWPLIGKDQNNDGIGEPVISHKKPSVPEFTYSYVLPISDEFDTNKLGLQWQWNANFKSDWAFSSKYGFLRLNCMLVKNDSLNFWKIPNLLLQKIPAEEFTAEVCMKFYPKQDGDRIGMIIMGEDYAYIEIINANGKKYLSFNSAYNASTEIKKISGDKKEIFSSDIYLKLEMKRGGICQFYFSEDGKIFEKTGSIFIAKAGRWIGAKIGVFALKDVNTNNSGYADVDWFRVK